MHESIVTECPNCEHCGGSPVEPCTKIGGMCKMHTDLATVRSDIRELVGKCHPQWTCEHELNHLKDQRRHMNMIFRRVQGEKWQGSKEGEHDEQFRDVDQNFRPITRPQYHNTKSKDLSVDPIVMPPAAGSTGIAYLDKNLRDMTGVLFSTSHQLTHEVDRLT